GRGADLEGALAGGPGDPARHDVRDGARGDGQADGLDQLRVRRHGRQHPAHGRRLARRDPRHGGRHGPPAPAVQPQGEGADRPGPHVRVRAPGDAVPHGPRHLRPQPGLHVHPVHLDGRQGAHRSVAGDDGDRRSDHPQNRLLQGVAEMTLIILAVGLFGAAAYLLLSGLTVRQREVAVALRRAKRYGVQTQREVETRKSVNDRIVGPLTHKVAAVTSKFLPRTDPNQIANRLMAAGLARSMSPQMYLALKGGLVFTAIAFGLIVLVSGMVPAAMGMLVALGGGAIGYIAPDFFINSRTRGRREIMQQELPNILDLLCVSVEAGLGFDAAVAKLSERMVG